MLRPLAMSEMSQAWLTKSPALQVTLALELLAHLLS
jgi:hypothetical protein